MPFSSPQFHNFCAEWGKELTTSSFHMHSQTVRQKRWSERTPILLYFNTVIPLSLDYPSPQLKWPWVAHCGESYQQPIRCLTLQLSPLAWRPGRLVISIIITAPPNHWHHWRLVMWSGTAMEKCENQMLWRPKKVFHDPSNYFSKTGSFGATADAWCWHQRSCCLFLMYLNRISQTIRNHLPPVQLRSWCHHHICHLPKTLWFLAIPELRITRSTKTPHKYRDFILYKWKYDNQRVNTTPSDFLHEVLCSNG